MNLMIVGVVLLGLVFWLALGAAVWEAWKTKEFFAVFLGGGIFLSIGLVALGALLK